MSRYYDVNGDRVYMGSDGVLRGKKRKIYQCKNCGMICDYQRIFCSPECRRNFKFDCPSQFRREQVDRIITRSLPLDSRTDETAMRIKRRLERIKLGLPVDVPRRKKEDKK